MWDYFWIFRIFRISWDFLNFLVTLEDYLGGFLTFKTFGTFATFGRASELVGFFRISMVFHGFFGFPSIIGDFWKFLWQIISQNEACNSIFSRLLGIFLDFGGGLMGLLRFPVFGISFVIFGMYFGLWSCLKFGLDIYRLPMGIFGFLLISLGIPWEILDFFVFLWDFLDSLDLLDMLWIFWTCSIKL